jgi:transposase
VARILDLSAQGLRHRQIAEITGVGFRSIADIVNGKTYANLPRPAASKFLPRSRKLTVDQILEIKALLAAGGLCARVIGERYGVSAATIQFIKQGKVWHHITPPIP